MEVFPDIPVAAEHSKDMLQLPSKVRVVNRKVLVFLVGLFVRVDRNLCLNRGPIIGARAVDQNLAGSACPLTHFLRAPTRVFHLFRVPLGFCGVNNFLRNPRGFVSFNYANVYSSFRTAGWRQTGANQRPRT